MNPILEKMRVYLLIALGTLLFPILLFPRRKNKQMRVLVYPQLTRLGDLISATPVLRALKEYDENVHVAVAVSPKTAGILIHHPLVDELLILENEEYLSFFGIFRFFKKVRDGHFDWGFNIAASTLGTLSLLFGGVSRRVKITRSGRPLSEQLSDWMNSVCVPHTDGEYLPELYVRTVAALGVPAPSEIRKEVGIYNSDEEAVEKIFARERVPVNATLIGIGVSAGNAIKEWPVERFAELARQVSLIDENYHFVFIGTEADRGKVAIARAHVQGRSTAILDVPLQQLPALIKRFALYIAADSGPIHIAEAVGTPLIDIAGPVASYELSPRGNRAVVLTPAGIEPSVFAFRESGSV
ncbi:hypothetical protein COU17_03390, partial [Candidatus Kaiserbacteria bacterium CG10_big_fil_rev_8_21_14_0_10_49_17]